MSAALHVAALGAEPERGILWGMQRLPWIVEKDGRQFAVEMRHQRFQMPFTIRLEDFVKEDYPGLNKPRAFRSDVTRIQGAQEDVIRIEMNQPLRDSGLVLFQANWGPQNAEPGARLCSDFFQGGATEDGTSAKLG